MPIKLDMIPARLPPACPCSREIPFSPGSCSSFPCYPPCRVLNHLSYYGVFLFSSSPHTALPPGPSTSWVISPRRASADKVSLNFNTRPFPGFVQAIPDHPRSFPYGFSIADPRLDLRCPKPQSRSASESGRQELPSSHHSGVRLEISLPRPRDNAGEKRQTGEHHTARKPHISPWSGKLHEKHLSTLPIRVSCRCAHLISTSAPSQRACGGF